jgi:hypothetical protein
VQKILLLLKKCADLLLRDVPVRAASQRHAMLIRELADEGVNPIGVAAMAVEDEDPLETGAQDGIAGTVEHSSHGGVVEGNRAVERHVVLAHTEGDRRGNDRWVRGGHEPRRAVGYLSD